MDALVALVAAAGTTLSRRSTRLFRRERSGAPVRGQGGIAPSDLMRAVPAGSAALPREFASAPVTEPAAAIPERFRKLFEAAYGPPAEALITDILIAGTARPVSHSGLPSTSAH